VDLQHFKRVLTLMRYLRWVNHSLKKAPSI